jgi:integrase/recombinase XerD
MSSHNANNERIKRRYFTFLREAKRQSEASVDAAAMAIARFEDVSRFRDFKAFRIEQAIAFKKRLAEQLGDRSGEPLSKATSHAVLGHVKRFFVWLAGQPGYRSRLRYSDAEYFNLPEKDARIATARRERPYPTLEQVKHVIATMPRSCDVERRNRALVAFTLLTGARDTAIASMRLKHVDLAGCVVNQDARQVNTKNSKTFPTFFFPVGDDVVAIVADWIAFLREERLWGHDDPLFPGTDIAVEGHRFKVVGLKREHWQTATPIRTVFKEAFTAAGLPYFNPHSIRKTLVALGETRCQTPEQFKAWSQNLGHEGVLTTFYSYGAVASTRQRELITTLLARAQTQTPTLEDIAEAVARRLSVP